MLSDKELINGCRRNNSKFQKILYEKYKRPLMGLCIRYAKNREEAEDIFHEAFIKIYKGIEKIKQIEYLERWLKQVTINTAIDHYHKNQKIKHESLDDLSFTNRDYEKIISQISNKELLEEINNLPQGYKMVFNMYVIDGYTHKEIASIMKISEGTSKSQLKRAKDFLQKRLKVIGVKKFEKYG